MMPIDTSRRAGPRRRELPLSPRGKGREAMTYGCVARLRHVQHPSGAAVSHLAELVRGDCSDGHEGPLIRPFGAPCPQGEKGGCGPGGT